MEVFFSLDLIEAHGTGMQKIMNSYQMHDQTEVKVSVMPSG